MRLFCEVTIEFGRPSGKRKCPLTKPLLKTSGEMPATEDNKDALTVARGQTLAVTQMGYPTR